jgi:hypothetical protein
MFERGTNVEIRRRFSEETREALSEEQHIEADVDRDCFISANPDWRDKNPRPSSKWVTAHGSASRIMAEQRKFTKCEEVKNKFVCLRRYRQDEEG